MCACILHISMGSCEADIPSLNVIPREIAGSIHNQDDMLEIVSVRFRPEWRQSKMKADGIQPLDPTFHNVFPLDPGAKRIQPSALSRRIPCSMPTIAESSCWERDALLLASKHAWIEVSCSKPARRALTSIALLSCAITPPMDFDRTSPFFSVISSA